MTKKTKVKKVIFKEEDFVQNIKGNCAICGTGIPKTWKNYSVRGNVCVECSVKTNKYSGRK